MTTPDLNHWKPALRPKPITLEGRTVTLEPLNATRHATALWQAIRGRDDLWTWFREGPYADEESFRASVLTRQTATDAIFFAIVPKSTGQSASGTPRTGLRPWGEAAGWASYMRMEPAHGVIEVGSVLFSPALQRTTAATEAMYLMAKHVFEDLGYRRYEWKCNAENLPSRRAAERLGFTFEGIFRQHQVVKGRNRDTAWFAMLDCEWPARKRVLESWLAPENFNAEGRQHRSLESFR